MSKYRALRGMPDILPGEADIFFQIENKAREVFNLFEFSEIRTPMLEETEVFTRSIGEDTDIVEKEMYSFSDRGGKNISLRPEGTASIIRAYIQHGLKNAHDILKLFYIGPMFRAERPQKGRLRQFHQIGAEIIGASDPVIDVELILNAKAVLENIGVRDFEIGLNTLGCAKDRTEYKEKLKSFLSGKVSELCENCRRRLSTNVLRVFDCKSRGCKAVVEQAPVILDELCGKCRVNYEDLLGMLKKTVVNVKQRTDLVRGLDYYTGPIFEITHPLLGAQDAIAAGGRYDVLTRQMGGPDVGATGYSIGIERLLLAIEGDLRPREDGVLVIAVDADSRDDVLAMAGRLRSSGIACSMDSLGRSLKSSMRRANKEKRRYVVLIGEDEKRSETYLLKDMKKGLEKSLPFDEILKVLQPKGKNVKDT
ncbi:MAG: histidine--tRNA ligase [Candidatus Omnitrophica bacterium]|nr:histidine--tRNA ligase [Candidatus Omnitrophota bacterium]